MSEGILMLKPKNWQQFQHYKDRCPPWVKLHRDLLNNKDFMRLPTASKALSPMFWLLASESKSADGVFDASDDELEFRLRMPMKDIQSGRKSLIDNGFFQVASGVLAERLHVAIPEESREERESEKDTYVDKVQSVISAYHRALPELPQVRVMNDKRKKAILKFWDFVLTSKKTDGQPRATNDEEVIEWVTAYFTRVRDNAFLMGKIGRVGEHSGWQCDLDYLLTDKGMTQVIEKTREAA